MKKRAVGIVAAVIVAGALLGVAWDHAERSIYKLDTDNMSNPTGTKIQVNDRLYVTNGIVVNAAGLTVTGDVTVVGTSTIGGTLAGITNSLTVGNDLIVGDALTVSGAVTIAEGVLTDSTVVSADIKNGEIVDADINASAAIVATKLSSAAQASLAKADGWGTVSNTVQEGASDGAEALPIATNALVISTNALTQAQTAEATGTNGVTIATNALAQAQTAQATGTNGVTIATNALAQAQTAQDTATNGVTIATNALAQAQTAQATGTNGVTIATNALAQAQASLQPETATFGAGSNALVGTWGFTNSVAAQRYLYAWVSATAGGIANTNEVVSIAATTGTIMAGGGADRADVIFTTDASGVAVLVLTANAAVDKYLNVLMDNRTVSSAPLVSLAP